MDLCAAALSLAAKADLDVLDPPQAGRLGLDLHRLAGQGGELVPLVPPELQLGLQGGGLGSRRQGRRHLRRRGLVAAGDEQDPPQQHAAGLRPAACAENAVPVQGYSPLPVASPSAPASTLTVLVTVPVTVAVQVLPEQFSAPTLMLSTRA